MSNPNNPREVLADYVDQRIGVCGIFDRLTTNRNPNNPFKVALLQEVEVDLSKAKYDVGHLWVQHAETLVCCQRGDRLRCTCRVQTYRKKLDSTDVNGVTHITDYSLSYPNEIKLLGLPVAAVAAGIQAEARPAVTRPPEKQAPPRVDLVQAILRVQERTQKLGGWGAMVALREAAVKVGGWGAMVALREAAVKVGGWEYVHQVQGLAEEVGGWDRLEQLIALLKLQPDHEGEIPC